MKIPQEIIDRLNNKSICILGLGREGLSTYRLLRKILPDFNLTLADASPHEKLSDDIKKLISTDDNIKLSLEENYLENIEQYEIIFKTPGIPLSTPQIQQALKTNTQISSNLQLFLEIIELFKQENDPYDVKLNNYKSGLLKPITIGVTGTKGKSTTAAVIHQVLAHNNSESILVGNIGQPALDYIDQITAKTKIVIELSSHQLDQLTISPDIAIIQEVKSEHLDYFPDQKAYVNSKKSITRYQKANQYVIYNQKWKLTSEIATLSPGKKLYFQLNQPTNEYKNDILVYLKSYYLTYNDINKEIPVIKTDDVPILGKHNLLNVAPAIIVGKMFGLSFQQIAAGIKNFKPLPHRLEKIATKNGISYINDSMATMPDAAISALSCFDEQPIILLAGGHERQQDFQPFAEKIIQSKVKAIALFPPNGQRLWNEIIQKQQNLKIKNKIQHKIVHSMEEALEFAQQHAQAGDVVLLAPGAASFGVFKNYADRGEQFRDAVSGVCGI